MYFGLNSLQPAYLIVGDRNTGFNPQLSGRDFSVYVVIEEVRILHDPPVSHPTNAIMESMYITMKCRVNLVHVSQLNFD